MAKRKYCETELDDAPIKKICKNGNLVRPKSEAPVLNILRQAARKLWSSTNSSESKDTQEKCRICDRKLMPQPTGDSRTKCSFCEHVICYQCLINCNQCGYQFCSFCAVNVYSPVGDIGRCLTCF